MNDNEFACKVAVVTGGGRGFGKAFGHALADRGTRVVLVDSDQQACESAAAEIGQKAETAVCSVADEAAIFALMEDITRRHGGIDILINNAAIHSAEANEYIGKLGIPLTRRMFDVNIWGVIYCTLAARPFMAGRAGASIVNLASTAAYGSQKAYGVTKLAVRGLTASFAHELGPENIRVNAIAPGLIMTDTNRAQLPQSLVDQVRASQIMAQEGEERDIVEAMLWLVSSKSSFMTGETLRVSGGATLQI